MVRDGIELIRLVCIWYVRRSFQKNLTLTPLTRAVERDALSTPLLTRLLYALLYTHLFIRVLGATSHLPFECPRFRVRPRRNSINYSTR